MTGAVLALAVDVCARAPMLISVRDRCRAAGRRHDGDGVRFPLGDSVAAARSLEAVHADVAAATCREPAAVHRRDWGSARTIRSCGCQRLLAEF